ncbi:MAG: hypothetical protein PHU81_05785 [Acidobacteriota bacterium]|nr:hypothetical protein [Acidobacteriota bacterium]
MKKYAWVIVISAVFLFCIQCQSQDNSHRLSGPTVTVDYEMAEKAIDWLEYLKDEPDPGKIRKYFMAEVAPTKGCQAIIHHWQRFRDWDEEIFLNFILEALNRIPTDKPIKSGDGSRPAFGLRQSFWLQALNNTERLREDLKRLKEARVREAALDLAGKYLPGDADISNHFYVVLFGASSAFSVGEENGYDLLQLPKRPNGEIDVQNVIETFAHEMHHSGFSHCTDKHMSEVKNKERIMLAGILAGEGMPTHFINRVRENLQLMKSSSSEFSMRLASEWEHNLSRLPELYQEAEKDIRLNMKGEIGQKEIFEKWVSGLQGPAYVLGSDMFSVMEKYLGLEETKTVARDYRLLLSAYNRAAEKARMAGENLFLFDNSLVRELEKFSGDY